MCFVATFTSETRVRRHSDGRAHEEEGVESVGALIDHQGEVELLRVVAVVLEARGMAFAASQVRRAVARIEQGA